MRRLKYIVSILFIVLSITAFGQETKMVKNRKKQLEKQEKNKEKETEKSIEEGKKRHMNIQTKAVKKRMKKQKKKSTKLNRQRAGKKKSFFARIFGGKG